MNIKFLDLKSEYLSIKRHIDKAIMGVIIESAFIGGKYVKTFEDNFARYTGSKYCIGVGNCTDALHISLRALGIKPGDEVITVANTFIATAEAITLTGAKVVFVDCTRDTYNIDVKNIEKAITKRTKAIIPVHIYGQPVDMDPILEISAKYNIAIIEDCAQAHGAKYKGSNIGLFGKTGCFSFFPGKNLGAYGDAGAIITNNDTLAMKIRKISNHGRIEKYNHEFEGLNSRLDGIQAAILNIKLKYLENWINRRREIAKLYDKELHEFVTIPYILPNVKHVYHLYVIQINNRDKIRQYLADKGISTGIHYPLPLPLTRAYKYLGYNIKNFPVASSLKDKIISLPISGNMTDKQVYYVISQLKNAVSKHKRS